MVFRKDHKTKIRWRQQGIWFLNNNPINFNSADSNWQLCCRCYYLLYWLLRQNASLFLHFLQRYELPSATWRRRRRVRSAHIGDLWRWRGCGAVPIIAIYCSGGVLHNELLHTGGWIWVMNQMENRRTKDEELKSLWTEDEELKSL